VPPSPSRIAPASLTPSRGGEIRVDELLGASLDDGVRGGTSHQVPAGAPGARSSTSTAMAGRGRLPPKEHVELLGIVGLIDDILVTTKAREALDARMHPGDKALVDELFGGSASETVHPPAAAAYAALELDEIQPGSTQQQVGTVRTWSQIGTSTDTEALHKRRTLNRATETNESRVGSGPFVEIPVRDLDDDNDSSGSQPPAIAQSTAATRRPQAPEAAKVLELAECVMSGYTRRICDNLGKVLRARHPGIPESMHKTLPQLVCQEWDRAFGPQAQVVGPRCPTIEDLKIKSRLQAVYVSTRLLDEGNLPRIPPGIGVGESLPAATDELCDWTPNSNQARNTLSLICAAKANGMTDAEATALAKEKVMPATFTFIRRMAHSGESNLAMVHALYDLESASTERCRSSPSLNMKQNYRTAFGALMHAFERKYGDPGLSAVAARAALREWLPPSLKELLPEVDNPARLEMGTLLMEAANAGKDTLGNVCSYLIMATDAPPAQRSALMAIAQRSPELVKLRDRLRGPPAP
jgi:hypothetical protein